MARTKIYYAKPKPVEVHIDLMMGFNWLCRKNPDLLKQVKEDVTKTHVLLEETDKTDLEDIFLWYQGENWSPHGEARELIRSKGLAHTSMSVGDIVELDGVLYFCDNHRWNKLNMVMDKLFVEHDIVQTTVEINREGKIIPVSTSGTIVYVYCDGEVYVVEFLFKGEDSVVITVYPNEIESCKEIVLKTYKGCLIIDKDGVIVVRRDDSDFIVALDDSKSDGSRKIIEEKNTLDTAIKYIDWLTSS